MFLARLVASLLSPLELALPLNYSSFQSQQSQKQSRLWGLQAPLISVASVNVPVVAIPSVILAFPSTFSVRSSWLIAEILHRLCSMLSSSTSGP